MVNLAKLVMILRTSIAFGIGWISESAAAHNYGPTITEKVREAGGWPLLLGFSAGALLIYARAMAYIARHSRGTSGSYASLLASPPGLLLAAVPILNLVCLLLAAMTVIAYLLEQPE